jgi:hypothetical protein
MDEKSSALISVSNGKGPPSTLSNSKRRRTAAVFFHDAGPKRAPLNIWFTKPGFGWPMAPSASANRRHYFSAVAQALRHVLVERARRQLRERHGGALQRVDVDDVEIAAPTDDEQLVRVNSGLDELALIAPEKAEIVKLRFFAGLGEKEIAELLDLSPRTVERYWAYAKVRLFERIPK